MPDLHHTLVISLDLDVARGYQEEGIALVEVDPDELWRIDVRCPHDLTSWARDCMCWTECDCALTDEQKIDLEEAEDESLPCPTSPDGRHYSDEGGFPVAVPCRECMIRTQESDDGLWALIREHELGLGEYLIDIDDWDDNQITAYTLVTDDEAQDEHTEAWNGFNDFVEQQVTAGDNDQTDPEYVRLSAAVDAAAEAVPSWRRLLPRG